MAEGVEHPGDLDFAGWKPRSSQSNDFKIDTYHFLVRHSALLRHGKDWLAQCQDIALSGIFGWLISQWAAL